MYLDGALLGATNQEVPLLVGNRFPRTRRHRHRVDTFTVEIDHPATQDSCLEDDIELRLGWVAQSQPLRDMAGSTHLEFTGRPCPGQIDPAVLARRPHLSPVDVDHRRCDRGAQIVQDTEFVWM